MSAWYWRVIAVKAVFALTCFVSYLRAEDTIQKLPFCNPHTEKEASVLNDLVIVSTLDGKLTAFATDNGIKAWALDTQPLLSTNLHHVEFTSGGKWVRLIPSLRGSLYSLSGDSIEALPFDAKELLSSSFKYSGDLVLADTGTESFVRESDLHLAGFLSPGSHEALWLGLDSQTGSVIYECGSSGCNSEEQTARAGRDVLVLRRDSNTVRALDPRTGAEKWNFSVAEHQLSVSRRECVGGSGPQRSVAVAVALPEGVVAVRHPDTHTLLWQRELEAPVAGMWRLHSGVLEHMDVLWAAQAVADVATAAPSLYLGVHDSQLYILESMLYAQKLETGVSTRPSPWKVKQSRPLLTGGEGSTALTTLQDVDPNTLTQVALYGNAGKQGNNGFFIYLQETCDQAVQVTEEALSGPDIVLPNISDDQTNHHHVHVHVYSLWFWWKEVLLIAISSALLMNLMIWPRFFPPKLPRSSLPINQENIVVERYYERPPSTTEYSGRYESDFTPLRCLGRGGFGVVFEARNKIDDRPYAVKRITLPRRESKRERVLREVRALAKLEHENIVRYFNAWLEEPPPLWQEQRDAVLMRELEGVSLISEEYTSPSPASPTSPLPNKSPPKGGSVMLNLHRSIDDCIDALDYEKKLSEPRRLRSLSCNDSFSIVFDEEASKANDTDTTKHLSDVNTSLSKNVGSGDNDDSFIVFANTEEHSKSSEPRKDVSNKRLEKVKECEGYSNTNSDRPSRKKKGHTRHWSLDMCVRSSEAGAVAEAEAGAGAAGKMYLYIQMQLCRRESLHDWLRHNRTHQSRKEMVNTLFSQIASAVEYVHLAGLIHRDLKPSNIFFALDGKVKVGDFGLVTAMTDLPQDGQPQEVNVHARHTHKVGTHLYMSPEQLVGRPYSYKVDIYSLGLVLFELLQPFGTESERIACLMRLRHGHFPQQFQQHYPNETEVLKLMLSEDPSQRPTASGVRARAPLYQATDERWHFVLPALAAC